jgi:hypothetical protein
VHRLALDLDPDGTPGGDLGRGDDGPVSVVHGNGPDLIRGGGRRRRGPFRRARRNEDGSAAEERGGTLAHEAASILDPRHGTSYTSAARLPGDR